MTSTTQTTETKNTRSLPRILLSAEGLTVFISSIALYWFVGGNGWLFLALLLAPDLVFVIYALNKSAGITAYNLVHTYVLPIALGVIAVLFDWQLGLTLALIWLAHIGIDRTVGYGLKYQTNFKDTHLNRA